jgi:hypothetical protein
MKKEQQALVAFDDTGCFEIRDAELLALVGQGEVDLVAGGAMLTDRVCDNVACQNVGCMTVNTVCREGTLDVACHGNHTLNGLC